MTDQQTIQEPVRYLSPLARGLSVMVLFSFAISQPLLDLLGRNAVFFLARSAPAIDAIVLALLVGLVAPVLTGLIVFLFARTGGRVGRVVHLGTLALLAGALIITIAERTPAASLDGRLLVAGAILGGVAFALAYRRYENMRLLVRYATPAPLIFVFLFLFVSPASTSIVRTELLTQPGAVQVAEPAPIVFLVFDEFPMVSLIDGSGNLEEDVYPNFARLANDGTWFRNAVTVRQQTEDSIPAMLTGTIGQTGRVPFASTYPYNLFTVLSDAYDLHVLEAVTELCPGYACSNEIRQLGPPVERWSALVSDIAVVLGHLLVPSDLAGGLPPIDQSWGDFRNTVADSPTASEEADFDIIERFLDLEAEDRRRPVAAFVENIEPAGGQPPLYFGHFLLPHIPWRYLPTGQEYPAESPVPGSATTGWGDDEFLVAQAYQRHLLQVQLTDTLLGNVLDRLDRVGLYDSAMIVVVADHGITIRTGIKHRRVVTEETLADVAAIPLFIKRPFEHSGVVDDYRAETTDILPTMADVLGFDIPWNTVGVSLFASDRPERLASEIVGTKGTVTFEADLERVMELAQHKAAWFHDGGPDGFAPAGNEHLLRMSIEGTDAVSSTITVDVDASTRYLALDLDGDVLPARITGTVHTAGGLPSDESYLAVALNGRVVTITRTFEKADGTTSYSAMLPHQELRDGHNTIEFFLIDETGSLQRVGPAGR